jgi:plasmid stabilization system protein ParE
VRLDWSDRALERVRETARYIAADDPAAAVRWASELFDAVERLAEFPESGRLVPELEARGVRELVYGAYRVFDRVAGQRSSSSPSGMQASSSARTRLMKDEPNKRIEQNARSSAARRQAGRVCSCAVR